MWAKKLINNITIELITGKEQIFDNSKNIWHSKKIWQSSVITQALLYFHNKLSLFIRWFLFIYLESASTGFWIMYADFLFLDIWTLIFSELAWLFSVKRSFLYLATTYLDIALIDTQTSSLLTFLMSHHIYMN